MIEKLLHIALTALFTSLLTSIITRKYAEKERFKAFKTTFLHLDEMLRTGKLPDHSSAFEHTEYFKSIFDQQDTAMLKIRDGLKGKRQCILDKKWTEYKEVRQEYFNNRASAVITLSMRKEKINTLINKILEIAKHN